MESVQKNTSLIMTNGSKAERTRLINLDGMSEAKSSIQGMVCLESATTCDLLISK